MSAAGVYFIQSVLGGPVKIGRTTDIDGRMKALQSHSPVELRLIRFIVGGDEAALHRQFSHLRLHGEWFSPGPEIREFLGLESGDGAEVELPGERLVSRKNRVSLDDKNPTYQALVEFMAHGRWMRHKDIVAAAAEEGIIVKGHLRQLFYWGWMEHRTKRGHPNWSDYRLV